jgi:hypothetical protein
MVRAPTPRHKRAFEDVVEPSRAVRRTGLRSPARAGLAGAASTRMTIWYRRALPLLCEAATSVVTRMGMIEASAGASAHDHFHRSLVAELAAASATKEAPGVQAPAVEFGRTHQSAAAIDDCRFVWRVPDAAFAGVLAPGA